MQRTPWIDRKFHFEIPPGWMFNVLERLQGTGARIRELTAEVSDANATASVNGKWSIKQHVGHLTDLEALHVGRISDFIFREPVLRAADMTNAKTNLAGHNNKPLIILISEFIEARDKLVLHLQKLDDDTQQFASLHPRLKTYMRPVDMAFFTAEHDDHHLCSIRALI